MQTSKNRRENINARPGRFSTRIGPTVFTVNIHFKEDSKESVEDKMYRMMQSDLNNGRFCGIMKTPQADWLPERGAV